MNAQEAWRLTLLEWEAAKHYHQPYALIIGWTFRNPLIEHILPSVVLVKAVAVFDEAVEEYIYRNHSGLPSGYRATLDGRIRFLVDRSLVANGLQLHKVRELRNRVAHEKDAHATWQELEGAFGELETALVSLNLVQPRPQLDFFGERSEITLSDQPGILGTRTFTIGVRENGSTAYQASWTQTLHRLNPDASGLD
jgi:hypothetical protein